MRLQHGASIKTPFLNTELQLRLPSFRRRGGGVSPTGWFFAARTTRVSHLRITERNQEPPRLAKPRHPSFGRRGVWYPDFGYQNAAQIPTFTGRSPSDGRGGDTNALTYKQAFDYDRFGNLYRNAASNPTTGQQNPLPFTPIEDTDINKAKNQFATGTTYDEAGQVTTDNKFRSMGFSYDANGRVVKATRASTPDATTVYDALGNRVATRVNDVWQYMIYDAFGKLVAEYGVASEGMGGVKYLQQDHQGSVRTVTNSNGFVVARTDHQAFGENVGGGVGLRTTSQGYGADVSTRQSYGLTENDDASGQQHTWFRKLETQAGRFSSPDPYNGSMSLGDPQSFNRYSYTRNEPTNYVDPSGLQQMICMIEGMQTNCSTAFGVINNGGPIRVWSGDGYVSVSARISNEQMGSWYAGGILYRLDSNILLTSHQSQVGIGIVGRVPSIGPPTGPPATTPLPPPEGPCGAIGVDVSVFAGVGAGNGVAATAGITAAHDVNGHNQSTWVGPHGGAFLGGSGQPGGVGYPSNRGWGIGAAASAGPALFLSNEGSPQDQPGVFSTHIVTIQPLSVAVDRSPSGAVTNVSIGAGVGAGYFTFNTNTGRVRDATTPFRGGCK